jgi:hypothetical protein
MKKLRNLVLGLSLAAVACSTGAAANLATYNINLDTGAGLYGIGNGHGVRVAFADSFSYAGFIGAFTASNGEDSWYSFCTDVTATLKRGEFNYYAIQVDQNTPHTGGYQPWSVGGMQAAAAIYKTHVGGLDRSENRSAYGAALQLAIWEALYDTDDGAYGLGQGRFTAEFKNGAVGDYFARFMGSAQNSYEGVVWLKPDSSNGYQGNLRLVSVPEPAMLLSSLLALGLGWVGRRRLV